MTLKSRHLNLRVSRVLIQLIEVKTPLPEKKNPLIVFLLLEWISNIFVCGRNSAEITSLALSSLLLFVRLTANSQGRSPVVLLWGNRVSAHQWDVGRPGRGGGGRST